MGRHTATLISCYKADLSLVNKSYNLHVIFGIEPLGTSYGTWGNEACPVTRASAPCYFSCFSLSDCVSGTCHV